MCFLVAIMSLLAFVQLTKQPTRDQPPMLAKSGALTIGGRVTTGSGRDARPVRHAVLRLQREGDRAERAVNSDTTGGFLFDGVPAGAYRLVASKPGFVAGGYGARDAQGPSALDVKTSTTADVTLTRAGAIEGVLADASGEPLQNIMVGADFLETNGNWRTAERTRTDDLGRYRIHSLRPGEYRVMAVNDAEWSAGQFVLPGERRPDMAPLYYPASPKPDGAKTITVTEGRDVTGIDIGYTLPPPIVSPDAPRPPLPGTVAGTGRIAGRVTTEGGRPIKGASLFVVRTDGQSISKPARTDAQGRFAVTELPAGRFQVSAAADRYLGFMFGQRRSNEPGTPIQLIEGGSFTTADIRLPRQVGIEGTILDEFGDPAPSVTVVPARWMYAGGRKRIIPMEGRGLRQTTDDRGHYRIYGLATGEYFVTTQVGIFGDAIDLGGYAPTYYPGTADGSGATTVQPTTGADVLNASFSLVAVRTVTVSGFAVDGGGQPVSGAAVTLSLSDRAGRAEIRTTRAAAGSDGRFVLANVPPGPYTLQGFGPPPSGGRQPWPAGDFGWTPIIVGDADIDDVVIRITPGRALRGRFMKEETEGPPIVFEKVRMTLLPVETDSSPIAFAPPPSTFREDGTFELTNLTGLRRLMVTTTNPAWALKRITLNGRDVTDVPFDFREKDVEGVEIVLTSKVTTVTGGVVDNKGQPLSDYAVVLFTSDPTKWGERSRFVTVARPAQGGEFSVRGLPPDDYLAVALPLVNGTEHYDPAFLDPLRPIATAFTLSDGESKTLSLKLKNRQ